MTISYHDVYQSTCFLRHFPQIFIRLIHKIPTSFNSNQPKTCIITDFSTVLYFLRKSHRRGTTKRDFLCKSPRPHNTHNRIILGLAESSTTIIRHARFVRAHIYMCIYIHTYVCICTYILHVKSYIIHTHIYTYMYLFFQPILLPEWNLQNKTFVSSRNLVGFWYRKVGLEWILTQ